MAGNKKSKKEIVVFFVESIIVGAAAAVVIPKVMSIGTGVFYRIGNSIDFGKKEYNELPELVRKDKKEC